MWSYLRVGTFWNLCTIVGNLNIWDSNCTGLQRTTSLLLLVSFAACTYLYKYRGLVKISSKKDKNSPTGRTSLESFVWETHDSTGSRREQLEKATFFWSSNVDFCIAATQNYEPRFTGLQFTFSLSCWKTLVYTHQASPMPSMNVACRNFYTTTEKTVQEDASTRCLSIYSAGLAQPSKSIMSHNWFDCKYGKLTTQEERLRGSTMPTLKNQKHLCVL